MNFRRHFFVYLQALGFLVLPTVSFAQSQAIIGAGGHIIDSLEIALQNGKEDTNRVNTLNVLSKKLYIIGKYDSSLRYANIALSVAGKTGYEKGRGYALKNIGVCYDFKGNYPASLKNLQDGLSVFWKIKYKEGISVCLNNMGSVYRDEGNLPESLENYLEALVIGQEMGDTAGISYCFNNIGNVYKSEGNYPKALEYLLKASDVFNKTGDKYAQANCLMNVGSAYHYLHDSSKSLEYYRKALIVSREIGENDLRVRTLYNIAILYYEWRNYTMALEYDFNALSANKEIDDIGLSARIYNNIGDVYIKKKDFSAAKTYLDSAGINLQKKGDREAMRDLYLSFTVLDSANGNYKKGWQDYESYIKLRDSTIGVESHKDIALLQMRFEDDKKQQADSLQHAGENKINVLKLERQHEFSIGGTVALVAVLILLMTVFFQRNKIKKEKIHSDANLRTIFDNTDISYILLDRELNIVSYNQYSMNFFNDLTGNALKRGTPVENYLYTGDRERILGICRKALEGKYVQNEENYNGKDGMAHWNNWRLSPVKDNHNAIIGVMISISDITSAKLSAIEREKMTLDLVQRNKDLEQFAFIVSHNLRAPVANIIALSHEIGNSGLPEEERKEMLAGLAISVRKLDGVIMDLNQILHVKGEINEQKEKVTFSKLVDDIKVQIDQLIKKENVKIDTDFQSIDEAFTLKSYLYSIFYNLISNAIKYHNGKSPAIEITSRKVPGKMILTFRDNGLGIDLEEKKGQVFGLYKRFHSHVEGKGIGLFMCKLQAEALGGTINVKSKVNKGTTFTVELPV